MADRIYIADKPTLDQVKSKVDANLDSKVSTRSSQVSVDLVKTTLDQVNTLLNTNLDTKVASRQANWGATTTHSSRIDTNISSRASQASIDVIGAKIDGINTNLKMTTFNGRFQNQNTTYATALNLSGSGILYGIAASSINDCDVRITIDGVVVINSEGWGALSGGLTTGLGLLRNYGQPISTTASSDPGITPMHFKQSLRIEVKAKGTATNRGEIGWLGAKY